MLMFVSSTYICPNLFQKLNYHMSGVFFSFYYKQRIYHRKNALLSQIGGDFPPPSIFSIFSYLGGCKISGRYPRISHKNIFDIYKYLYSTSKCQYYAEYLVDIEQLSDSQCIPAKRQSIKLQGLKRQLLSILLACMVEN